MNRRPIVLALLLACVAAATPMRAPAEPVFALPFGLQPFVAPPALVFVYRGWRVDAARSARAQSPAKTVRLVKAQLDLVESAGLKPALLDAMRAVPIAVVAGIGPDAATYGRAPGVVVFARRLDKTKPTLLRELLAAYYDRAAPAGAAAAIGRYRRQVLARRVWPKSAAMLQNDRDFFAITAAAYLHGAITREPYNRANLRMTQPDYYRWLATFFDEGRARV